MAKVELNEQLSNIKSHCQIAVRVCFCNITFLFTSEKSSKNLEHNVDVCLLVAFLELKKVRSVMRKLKEMGIQKTSNKDKKKKVVFYT